MSWFDTTKGLAGFAKSAIKEAQKKIDKALDIQEEISEAEMGPAKNIITNEGVGAGGGDVDCKPGGSNLKQRSNTTPSTPNSTGNLTTSTSWDSTSAGFTGSFFDNPNTKENNTVTTPPKASTKTNLTFSATSPTKEQQSTASGFKRQSVTSNSASVELLSSSPTSPEPASLSEAAINSIPDFSTSDSVELVTDSIVIIGNNETGDDDEDSISTSYNTIMNDMLNNANAAVGPTDSVMSDTKSHTSATFTKLPHSNSNASTVKLLMSMEDTQTVDSDSTQSFEEVQMQTSAFAKVSVSPTSDSDKLELVSTAPQSYSSPPNSNDEMETTTSSDIEIISNPNGCDSSSTNSIRASPLKLKKLSDKQASAIQAYAMGPTKKGHHREHSEISVLSEDSQSELDKLMQRINELNQLLETREMRLLQSERHNAELQEHNSELQTMIDAIKGNTVNFNSADEYTQRVSALEKKFQGSIRERDALLIQVKSLKDELEKKVPKDDLTQLVTESNAVIAELQKEGEKLSKEILQQSNIIKKLRAKEKTSDALLKKNKEQIADMTEEVERLKKTLNAKEDVERTQIEAVHKMSSEKHKLTSQLEDLQMKLNTVQASMDACKAELKQRTTEETLTAKRDKELAKAENQEMLMQLKELREKLRSTEQSMINREQQLREENHQLLERLESAEFRAESSTQEISLTTIPLMRQLESLQNTLSQRTMNWNKEEHMLLEKLEISQKRLRHLDNMEAAFKEKLDLSQKRCKELEEKLSHVLLQEEKVQITLQQAALDYNLKESELKRQITILNDKLHTLEDLNQSLEESLQKKLATESKINISKTSDELQHDTFTESTRIIEQQQQQQQQPRPASSHSPAGSFGGNSFDEAMMGGSIDWQNDDLDCISNSGGGGHASNLAYGGMSINFMPHNTTTIEHLHSLLKQRDGELNHLQWELSRLQAERNMLSNEITNLTLELENAKDKLQTYETLETNYNDLQHRYDALLQMYGEKVERTEELELDIVELKEAYKAQIDELLAQPRRTT